MAYVSPGTKSTGDMITAAEWNQSVVNNEKAMPPDVFTTKGDLFAATAADAGARLAAGTNGKILVSDSTQATGLVWQSLVASRMGHHATNWFNGGAYPATPVTDYPTQIKIQVGEIDLVGDGGDDASATLTFPVAFSATPLVFVTAPASLVHHYVASAPIDGETATIRVWTDTGGTIGVGETRSVQWLAIGPT